MLAAVAVAFHPLWSASGIVSDDYPAVYLRVHQYFQEFRHGYLPAVFPDVVQGGGNAFPRFYPPLAYYVGAGLYGITGDIVSAGHLSALLSLLLSALTMTWAARQLGVPLVELEGREIPESVIRLVPERVQRARVVLPVAVLAGARRGPLLLATADPLDVVALDEAAFASGMRIRPLVAPPGAIVRAQGRHLDGYRFRTPIDLPPDGISEWDVDVGDLVAV